MKLNFCYDCSAKTVLEEGWSKKSEMIKSAGITKMWLFGYFYGEFDSSPEEMASAKKLLEEDGFSVGVINLPFGHGGNALNPNDPDVRLVTGTGWRYRVDVYGRVLPNTTCINEKVLSDSISAVKTLKDIGFTDIFYDDDLRFGMWGEHLQGCFCDECIKSFSKEYTPVKREVFQCDIPEALREAWCDFQCGKLTDFVEKVTIPGVKTGVMVMHNGDRRHGIDIKMLKKRIPNIFFRVGEAHFSNAAFEHELGKKSLLISVHNHMALIGDRDKCWSESTVYPEKALSPENLIEKIKMEISAGLYHIFLMSGTWFITEEYWKKLRNSLSMLKDMAEKYENTEPEHMIREPIWQL